jgi:excinuclease ABC subunit A
VITGVSGSGKSSLAFDTLYAEGQRRYVESLSSYARQFLERMEKPDVDAVEGLYPAIAVGQRNPAKGKRSTVGTATEVSDYLRLLFARTGRAMCSRGHGEVKRRSVDDVVQFVQAMPRSTRLFVTYPLDDMDGLSSKELASELLKEGFVRIFDNDTLTELEAWAERQLRLGDRILVVVDRFGAESGEWKRLADSVETCFHALSRPERPGSGHAGQASAAGGGWTVLRTAEGEEFPFSKKFACDRCGCEMLPPNPALFSFNHPQGACPACKGFGNTLSLDEQKIVPDPALTLEEGAVKPWDQESREEIFQEMLDFARKKNVRTNVPYGKLTKRERRLLWKGTGPGWHDFPGIEGFFEHLQEKAYKLHVRVYLSRYRKYTDCTACRGARLRPEALRFEVGGKTIADISAMTIEEAWDFLEGLSLSEEERLVADKIFEELLARLRYLRRVGLGYLTLDRLTATLSGGEAQRIALATLLGSALTGTLIILDEPTVGLHARDTEHLLGVLRSLRDEGNTLVVVEHDRAVIEAADHVVELGPGAGSRGGERMASHRAQDFRTLDTLTASYLRGEREVPRRSTLSPRLPLRQGREQARSKHSLQLEGVACHNLDGLNVCIPIGCMVVVTGVSGSGKSTLVRDVLFAEYEHHSASARSGAEPPKPLFCRRIKGFDRLATMALVDQSPLGRSARSNALTVTGALAPVRALFAATAAARARGYDAGHFSFNSPKGRCEACGGLGWTEVDMQFLANVRLPCEVCGGKRFQRPVLDIAYRGTNIHDVCEMTVDDAMGLFGDRPEVTERLEPLRDVGLGYLRLGQSTSTLSGGEAQRMKLASVLGTRRTHAVYLFDEPTTGLHLEDVSTLLSAFERLVESGNTLVVIEHHLDVIKNADWVIDLGPEAGARGGRIVTEGAPEEVARCEASHTGRFLRAMGLPAEGPTGGG